LAEPSVLLVVAIPAAARLKHLATYWGFCKKRELLRNNRHNRARTAIANLLRNRGWRVHEEIHCVSEDDSHRRVDIIVINRRTQKAMFLDPTICFERDTNQALQINDDKRAKYVPCLPYLSEKYGISLYNWDVAGLLFGARVLILRRFINCYGYLASEPAEGDNAREMNPAASAESYPAFALKGFRENPKKKLQPGQDACLRPLTGGWGVLSATVPGFLAFRNISARIHSLRALPRALRYLGRAVEMDPVLLEHLGGMNLGRGIEGTPLSERVRESHAAGGLVYLILIHPINSGTVYAMEKERNWPLYPIISRLSCLMSSALLVLLMRFKDVFGQLTKQQIAIYWSPFFEYADTSYLGADLFFVYLVQHLHGGFSEELSSEHGRGDSRRKKNELHKICSDDMALLAEEETLLRELNDSCE
ncbi:hypothetical protein ANN_19712, partial [Periplaneta americana]